MTRHNKHSGLLPAPTCYRLVVYVADLLQGSHQLVTHEEAGVMDFGLNSAS